MVWGLQDWGNCRPAGATGARGSSQPLLLAGGGSLRRGLGSAERRNNTRRLTRRTVAAKALLLAQAEEPVTVRAIAGGHVGQAMTGGHQGYDIIGRERQTKTACTVVTTMMMEPKKNA